MLGTIHVFNFLETETLDRLPSVVVLAGGQRYLTLLALRHLRGRNADSDWTELRLDGEVSSWAEVADEVAAKSLFAADVPKRIVVDEADKFVSNYRERLEGLVSNPIGDNVLILIVSKWLKTTRFHKQLVQNGLLVECVTPQTGSDKSQSPDVKAIAAWVVKRASKLHGLRLERDAAIALGELTDFEFGRMDQELAKLSLIVDANQPLTSDHVQKIVGGWQLQTVWKIADAVVDGHTARALELIDQLFESGQEAFGVFAQLAWSLRRYGQVFEHRRRALRKNPKAPLDTSLMEAGFRKHELGDASRRYRRIGPIRLAQISQHLLDADLAMKRTHSHEARARLVLEDLILRLHQ